MRRTTALLATLLTAILSAAIVLPADSVLATTGTYQDTTCNAAPEGANNSWVWHSTDSSSPDHYEKHESCPDRLGGHGGRTDQESGLSTTDALGLSNGAPPGTSAAWTFTAAEGTTIAGITYERYLGHELDASNYWAPALRIDGTLVPSESCLDTIGNAESCFVGGPPGEGGEPKTITGLSAHELAFGILCQAHPEEQCITGATQHSAWAAIYGATVTINDPTPPALNTPTGPLWEPTQYTEGTQEVTVEAEDIGGGVKAITLEVDGHPISAYTTSCDYTRPKPCPSTTGAHALSLNTTELGDGPHTIALVATDAADNQSAIASKQIDVENKPPPPPNHLQATEREVGGTTFTVTWTNPTELTAPITGASYQVCPADNSPSCGPIVSIPAVGPVEIAVPGTGTWMLAVRLTNAAGNTSGTTAIELSVPTRGREPRVAPTQPASGDPTRVSPGALLPGSPVIRPSPQNSWLYVSAVIHRHHIVVVRVTGTESGRLKVALTMLYRGRRVALAQRTGQLRRGRLTLAIRLPSRRTKRLLVSVSIEHGSTVHKWVRN
ncbi:MAG: hypothetical protein ACYDHN_03675 [Solirubrobacteraceae bacterium]